MRPDPRLIAALIAALGATAAQAQPCPNGTSPIGVIGVSLYHCVGGICWMSDTENRRHFDFSTEPRLRGIARDGPAADLLQDGDVLIAVDGMPITVPAAGRRLATLPVGGRVRLTVRRAERTTEVELTAASGCSIGSLAVTSDTVHPWSQRLTIRGRVAATQPFIGNGRLEHLRPRPNPGTLGIAIECARCGWLADGAGGHRWQAELLPKVVGVDSAGPAQRAGIRGGDTLTHIDGRPITSREGSDALADVRAGKYYLLRVLRGGHALTVELRADSVRN